MKHNIIDLTQTIATGIPDWDGSCGFQMKQELDYEDGARVQRLNIPNGIGTHMDAPSHFTSGGLDIAGIGVEHLITTGLMMDISKQANPNYVLGANDILVFEQHYGKIPEHSIVIIYTGWCHRWENAAAYRNVNEQGIMRFPTVSADAAQLLLNRNINGIAIDTLSPDLPDSTFQVHHLLLNAGKFIIENIKIPDKLPKVGFTIMALPIKIQAATEAPCRVIAYIG